MFWCYLSITPVDLDDIITKYNIYLYYIHTVDCNTELHPPTLWSALIMKSEEILKERNNWMGKDAIVVVLIIAATRE